MKSFVVPQQIQSQNIFTVNKLDKLPPTHPKIHSQWYVDTLLAVIEYLRKWMPKAGGISRSLSLITTLLTNQNCNQILFSPSQAIEFWKSQKESPKHDSVWYPDDRQCQLIILILTQILIGRSFKWIIILKLVRWLYFV